MTDFDNLLKEAKAASDSATQIRQEVLPVARQAILALETALGKALNGDPLRGLKNIGSNGVAFYGANVRASSPDQKLPHPSTIGSDGSYLVLNAHGELVMVCWEDGGDVLTEYAIADDDLRIDDVRDVINTLMTILPRHIRAARSTNKRYKSVYALARDITEATKNHGDQVRS